MSIMTLRHVLLGYLGWHPLTGYDLKKLVADSELLPWTGSSNQIYTTLVQLHRDGLVTMRAEQQESLPPRKVYSLTAAGRAELEAHLRSSPEIGEPGPFLAQMIWADLLPPAELDRVIDEYAALVEGQLAMVRERIRRGPPAPDRSPRESFLWRMAFQNRVRAWEAELAWTRDLRTGLDDLPPKRRRR
jgi:PadR family transcriptional regulator, regulatory protein AphA